MAVVELAQTENGAVTLADITNHAELLNRRHNKYRCHDKQTNSNDSENRLTKTSCRIFPNRE